jgi:hypothetical protein
VRYIHIVTVQALLTEVQVRAASDLTRDIAATITAEPYHLLRQALLS